MPAAWPEDPGDAPIIEANAASVLAAIAAEAESRATPDIAMAQRWHRDLYAGATAPPFPYYVGEVRDSDAAFPDLIGYEVQVGASPGVPAALVPQALGSFEGSVQTAAASLDAVLPVGVPLGGSRELLEVLRLCALVHGEWVRIHPFANGNGRTARLWANWAALRYGLPPFVRIKPRPAGDPYAAGAHASMRGQHEVMLAVFGQMLRDHVAGTP